jgi:hypothetical protein
MSSGSFQDMLSAWGHNESGNNYGYVSSLGFLGRYQFSEEGLMAIGWYPGDDNPHNMDFSAGWTGEAASFGAWDKWSFLGSPSAQDAAVTQWFDYLVADIQRLGMTQYLGQTLNGVPITMSGMLTGGSLVGVWALKSYLESGATQGGSDWYGTNVGEYVSRFAGFDTPYDDLGPAAPSPAAEPPRSVSSHGWEQVENRTDPQSSPTSGGSVYMSPGPYATIDGSDGADTIYASQGYDVLTGAGGADQFVFAREPWAPIEITDFQPGLDQLDLRPIFDALGYEGTTPFEDGYLFIQTDDSGGAQVLLDRDVTGGDPEWPNYFLHLRGVTPESLSAGDWIFQ